MLDDESDECINGIKLILFEGDANFGYSFHSTKRRSSLFSFLQNSVVQKIKIVTHLNKASMINN